METDDPRLNNLLDVIDAVRAEKWACTVRDVASVLRMSVSSTHRLIETAQQHGLVVWTDGVAGSLHTIRAHTAAAIHVPEEQLSDVQLVDDDWLARFRQRLMAVLDDEEWTDWVVDVARGDAPLPS